MIQKSIKALCDAIFPHRCLLCGNLFHPPHSIDEALCSQDVESDKLFNHLFSSVICDDCLKGYAAIESPICSRCGIMFDNRHDEDHICSNCIEHPPYYRIARSVGVYADVLQKSIHTFKYQYKIQLAKLIGALLLKKFLSTWNISDIDVIIPVPLHTARLKKRGFNQSVLPVKKWNSLGGMLKSATPHFHIDTDSLMRVRYTIPMIGLDRQQRRDNVKNSFQVIKPEQVRNKTILLIDDVMTTGATVNDCARAIVRAGARSVDVLTLARAM